MSIKPGRSLLGEALGPDYDLATWFQREYEEIMRDDPIPAGADPVWQPAWLTPDCDPIKGIFGWNLRVPIAELRHWLDLGKNY